MMSHHGDAKRVAARVQIDNFMAALAQYRLDTNQYPTTDRGLLSLVRKPDNLDAWSGPYLKYPLPTDPWGHAYIYRYPGEHDDLPDVVSYGEDGKPGGEGKAADIVSCKYGI
ncbi:hypothetical protein F183_A33070 [Bryobacterales bacterium F-183]|nr:hypothetical protein F183_A33070 [Bryobacterales bacterium F-183]